MKKHIGLAILLTMFGGCNDRQNVPCSWMKEKAEKVYAELGSYKCDEERNKGREYVKMLLKIAKSHNFDERFENGETLLMRAIVRNDEDVIKRLISLECFADVNLQDRTGRTALVLAIKMKNIHIVTSLLTVGAMVNTRDKDGVSALMFAMECGCPEIINLLILHGSDKQAKDAKGQTVGDHALKNGNAKLIELL